MDLETLKQMLAEGKITQEEFDAKSKELNGGDGKGTPELTDELKGYIAGLIQSETDKVRTEYSKKLKEAEKKYEDDLKAKMTEKELAEYEKKVMEEKYEKEKEEFYKDKSKFMATQTLNKYGLLDEEMSFLDLVIDLDENAIDLKCQKLKASIDKKIEAEVKKRFKEEGRNPYDGDGGSKDGETENMGAIIAEMASKRAQANNEAQNYYFKN